MEGSYRFTSNGREVPQLHCPVRASGGQGAAIRAEGQRGYADLVSLPMRQFTSGRDFQQSNCLMIFVTRSEETAVRAFGERLTWRRLERLRGIVHCPTRPDLFKQRLPGS